MISYLAIATYAGAVPHAPVTYYITYNRSGKLAVNHIYN
jgi:hypothetical protein